MRLIVCFFVFLLSLNNAISGEKGRGFAQAILGGFQLSSPAAEQFGVKLPHPDTISIVNSTPLHAILATYGEETVVHLGPGDSAYHDEYWEPLQAQIPVAAKFYRECAEDKEEMVHCSGYVGAAGRIFWIAGQGGRAQSWLIRLEEIRKPDGQYLYRDYAGAGVYPPRESKFKSREIKIPRRWWNAQNAVQIVGNTYYKIRVHVNGRPLGVLNQEGGFLYFDPHALSDRGFQVVVQLFFVSDNDMVMGTAERTYYVPGQGIRAEQWIVSPFDKR